jgi:FkbH-like protein
MPIVAKELASVAAPFFSPPRKCVVVDVDNTLWGGVIGEDGPDGISLGVEYPGSMYRRFQVYLKALRSQGTLLAINSKNNEHDVMDFLATSSESVLEHADFAACRINWQDKATNLRELAAELNIDLDSMVFVDDSEVECDLIASLLPQVLVRLFPKDPLRIPDFIQRFPEMDVLHVTDEDRQRADSMKANTARDALRTEAADLDSFIRSLQIRLHLRLQPEGLIPRIAQLTQRTNQFNLTTRRYTEDDIRTLMHNGFVFTLGMADRFSDYGTVSAAILRLDGAETEIDTLLLSCRAFGREVEHVFVDRVLREMASRGYQVVRASYSPTSKNGMVADFYDRCGFQRTTSDGPLVQYRRSLQDLAPNPTDSRYAIHTEGFE